jgi:hypothetical protein
MVSTMKEADDDAHSLDSWTLLGKAASNLLTKLRVQAQPDSRNCEQAQLETFPETITQPTDDDIFKRRLTNVLQVTIPQRIPGRRR